MKPDLKEQIRKLKDKGVSEERIKATIHMLTILLNPMLDIGWGQHSVQLIQSEKDKNSLGTTEGYARLSDISKNED